MKPESTADPQDILLISPTLKIAGGFITVSRITADLQEEELRKLEVAGAPDHEWPGLSELLAEELARGHRKLILDLRKVPWMNSRGLGRLIEMWRQIRDAGGKPALVVAEGRILTILEISQVNLLMNPLLSVEAAVEHLSDADS